MHVSRKRYRPLDSAEERAVHVGQRVHLLALEDEQSYCFSWPEAPLTQWLQENGAYAALHQLVAGAGGGLGGAAVTNDPHLSNAVSGRADTVGGSTAATGPASSGPSFAAGLGPAPPSTRRQLDLPPVFTLDGVENDRGSAAEAGVSGVDVHSLLCRLRCEIDAVHQLHTTAGVTEAARALPHPLAPPRPQSITEDSIFTLSEPQLADLCGAGVPALCAAAEAEVEEGSQRKHQELQQRRQQEEHATQRVGSQDSSAKASSQGHDGDQRGDRLSATQGPAVVEVFEDDGTAATESDERRPWSFLRTSPVPRASPASPPHHHFSCMFDESHRRAVESEVVGLEWRTWTQSQRTAAALQRLLSLEAAVPFEPSGNTRRDAWRVVVYRLWLRWRRQGLDAPPDSAARAAGPLQWSGQPLPASPRGPAPSSLSPAPPSYMQAHRLPWGPPLLAGAYLYGTSNDYFISLPQAAHGAAAGATLASGSDGSGGGRRGRSAAAGPGGGATPSSSGVLSAWPAMSRRRGSYNFLRWKVELHEAQMTQRGDNGGGSEAAGASAAGAVVPTESDALRNAEEDQEGQDGEQDEGSDDDDASGANAGEVTSDEETVTDNRKRGIGTNSARPNTYAKGPLGGATSPPSARAPKRRSLSDTAASAPSSASPTTRRSSASRTASAAAPPLHADAVSHQSPHAVMTAAHIRSLIQSTVLTQPLAELQMDDEPGAVMERLSCPDLRHETDAWRVWLSKV